MKLLLSLLALCTFSATAGALTCLQCTSPTNPNCLLPATVTCSATQTRCINSLITDQDNNQRIFRDCAGPGMCPDVGLSLVEASVGTMSTAANRECCDKDNCNGDDDIGYPGPPQTNGRTCPGTDPPDSTFTAVVTCRGNEDTCFMGPAVRNGDVVNIGGCGSSDVCDFANELQQVPFIAGADNPQLTCTAITTTTLPPTTTTTLPPTTSTTLPPSSTDPPTPPNDAPPTDDMPKDPKAFLAKFKFLVGKLKLLSVAIKLQLAQLLQQHQLVIFQLHLQLLDYQQQLLIQQEGLPIDHYHQLPLYYQQCLLVSHHQLLLHQLHLSLSGQQHLLQLLYYQQVYVHQLQQLLHYHHGHLLPHYYGYLMHYYYNKAPQPVAATTPEEPTTTEESTTTAPVEKKM